MFEKLFAFMFDKKPENTERRAICAAYCERPVRKIVVEKTEGQAPKNFCRETFGKAAARGLSGSAVEERSVRRFFENVKGFNVKERSSAR